MNDFPRSYSPDARSIPVNVDHATGWVTRPNVVPDANGKLHHSANAYMLNNQTGIGMWVNDLSASFQMAGSQGQSKSRRSFFPHNFVAPQFTISGQTSNSFQYNRLARFIREHQLAVMNGVVSTVRFVLMGRTGSPSSQDLSRRIKGKNSYIDIEGYVGTMPAGAERWVNAPPYQFQFIVTKVNRFPGLQVDSLTGQQLAQATSSVNTTVKEGRTFFQGSVAKKKSDRKKASSEHQTPDRKPITLPMIAHDIGALLGDLF